MSSADEDEVQPIRPVSQSQRYPSSLTPIPLPMNSSTQDRAKSHPAVVSQYAKEVNCCIKKLRL